MEAAPEQSYLQAIGFFDRMVRAGNFALDNWWLWPVLGFAIWFALRLRAQHALMAKLDERADAAFGDVDVLLAERNALIGNLVRIVKAFATHERDMVNDVLDGRIEALEAIGNGGIAVESQVAVALQNLFNVAENFPELASEAHYRGLRQDLIRIEERITAARKFYNMAVEESNAVSRSFPASLIANKVAEPRDKFSLGERRAELAEPVQIQL